MIDFVVELMNVTQSTSLQTLFQNSKKMLHVVLGMYVICYPINISLLVIQWPSWPPSYSIMKRKLNNNCQQFHQYQQNEQPPLTSNHWTQKIRSVPGLGQAQQCGCQIFIYLCNQSQKLLQQTISEIINMQWIYNTTKEICYLWRIFVIQTNF